MESQTSLHPSVKEFKEFVKQHPGIMKEVQGGKRTLQHVYEEWSILGAAHEQWEAYSRPTENQQQTEETEQSSTNEQAGAGQTTSEEGTSGGTSEFLGQMMGLVKKMNVQDLQSHLTQFSSVLGNVQNLMQTFQKPQEQTRRPESDSPFSFRRD